MADPSYIYIYIYREREREIYNIGVCVCIYVYITYVYVYVYIYIYIYTHNLPDYMPHRACRTQEEIATNPGARGHMASFQSSIRKFVPRPLGDLNLQRAF